MNGICKGLIIQIIAAAFEPPVFISPRISQLIPANRNMLFHLLIVRNLNNRYAVMRFRALS